MEQAKQQASQAMDQAQHKAGQLADQAKQQATSQLASQKQRATDSLGGVAQALRQTGQQLRQQDQGMIARYADQAAGQIERFSGFLRGKDMNQLIDETEQFARREPTLFLGGAFVLGVLGARFLKSSGEQSQSSGGSTSMGRQSTAQTYQVRRAPEPRPAQQAPTYQAAARPTAVSSERVVIAETPRYGQMRGTEER
jgi:hypothetical protein